MRRFISFCIDVFLFLVICFSFRWAVGILLNIKIHEFLIFLVFLPFLFSFVEFKMKGRTPGKKMLGIKVVCKDGGVPPFRILFARASLIFFIPVIISLLIDLMTKLVGGPTWFRFDYFIGQLLLLALFFPPLVLSFFKQSLHDVFFETAVVSNNKDDFSPIKKERFKYFIVFALSLLIAILVFLSTKSVFLWNEAKKETDIQKEVDELFGFVIPINELDTGKQSFALHFSGGVKFDGLVNSMTVINEMYYREQFMSHHYDFAMLDPNYYIPAYSISVSESGILNHGFMDETSKSLYEFIEDEVGVSSVLVNYYFYERFLGVFYVTAKTSRLVTRTKTSFSPERKITVFSPDQGDYEVGVGFISPMSIGGLNDVDSMLKMGMF